MGSVTISANDTHNNSKKFIPTLQAKYSKKLTSEGSSPSFDKQRITHINFDSLPSSKSKRGVKDAFSPQYQKQQEFKHFMATVTKKQTLDKGASYSNEDPNQGLRVPTSLANMHQKTLNSAQRSAMVVKDQAHNTQDTITPVSNLKSVNLSVSNVMDSQKQIITQIATPYSPKYDKVISGTEQIQIQVTHDYMTQTKQSKKLSPSQSKVEVVMNKVSPSINKEFQATITSGSMSRTIQKHKEIKPEVSSKKRTKKQTNNNIGPLQVTKKELHLKNNKDQNKSQNQNQSASVPDEKTSSPTFDHQNPNEPYKLKLPNELQNLIIANDNSSDELNEVIRQNERLEHALQMLQADNSNLKQVSLSVSKSNTENVTPYGATMKLPKISNQLRNMQLMQQPSEFDDQTFQQQMLPYKNYTSLKSYKHEKGSQNKKRLLGSTSPDPGKLRKAENNNSEIETMFRNNNSSIQTLAFEKESQDASKQFKIKRSSQFRNYLMLPQNIQIDEQKAKQMFDKVGRDVITPGTLARIQANKKLQKAIKVATPEVHDPFEHKELQMADKYIDQLKKINEIKNQQYRNNLAVQSPKIQAQVEAQMKRQEVSVQHIVNQSKSHFTKRNKSMFETSSFGNKTLLKLELVKPAVDIQKKVKFPIDSGSQKSQRLDAIDTVETNIIQEEELKQAFEVKQYMLETDESLNNLQPDVYDSPSIRKKLNLEPGKQRSVKSPNTRKSNASSQGSIMDFSPTKAEQSVRKLISYLDSNILMTEGDEVIPKEPYNNKLTKIIEASQINLIDVKYGKLLFDTNGHVAGINTSKTKKEILDEELAATLIRRKLKVEKKRMAMKCGLIPVQEIDSDIDGLSSLSSIDEEYGIRGYNPNEAAENMKEKNKQHAWEVHKFLSSQPVSEQHQKYKKGEFLKQFNAVKQQEMEKIKFIDDDMETHQILMSKAQEVGLEELKKHDNPDPDQILSIIAHAFADASIMFQKRSEQENELKNPTGIIETYLSKMDPELYNPNSLQDQKHQFLKQIKKQMAAKHKGKKKAFIFEHAKTTVQQQGKTSGQNSPTRSSTSFFTFSGNQGHSHYHEVLFDKKHKDKQIHRFINKTNFYQQLKHINSSTIQEMLKDDTGYHHFKNMVEAGELPKSFMDGIRKKTLMMKEYTLSKGNTKSLMEAFDCLGDDLQRLILDNNSMKDAEFASILEAVNRIQRFDCIIYRNNEMGPLALDLIRQIMEKDYPENLKELCLQNVQMPLTCSETLFSDIIGMKNPKHGLAKLTLNNLYITPEQFKKIARYIRYYSRNLLELDLSYSKVGPKSFYHLIHSLARNKYLKFVNLSNNNLLPQTHTRIEPTVLNKEEMSVLKYIYIFCVRNPQIQHINLENTNLNSIIIYKLCVVMKDSNSLQAAHFSGNPGVTDELKQKVKLLMETNDGEEVKFPLKFIEIDPKNYTRIQKERQIADALQLKNLSENKDMEIYNINKDFEVNYSRMLLLQRNIGVKGECASVHSCGSAGFKPIDTWRVNTENDTECWICNKWQLLIILWNKHVGARGKFEELEYTKLIDISNFEKPTPQKSTDNLQLPFIYSSNSNWLPAPMSSITDYCLNIVKKKPNYLQEMKKQKIIPSTVMNVSELDDEQLIVYKNMESNFVKSLKHSYLEVFEKNFKYREPLIINLDTPEIANYPDEPLFAYGLFAKPGRFHYVIRSPQGEMVQYQYLNSIREEHFPDARFNDAVKSNISDRKFKKNASIFSDYFEDTVKNLGKCFEYDCLYFKVKRIAKKEEDFNETLKILSENYAYLKDLHTNCMATSSYYPYCQMPHFVKYFSLPGILDEKQNFNSKSLDRCFLAANLSNLNIDYLGKYIKHQNMMSRNQFIESICRMAQNKYMLPNNIPPKERILPVALRKFIIDLQNTIVYEKPSTFREKIWNNQYSSLYSTYKARIKQMMQIYIDENDIQNKYFTFWNFKTMMELFGLKEYDIIYFYAMSKITNTEEYAEKPPYKYNQCRFVELIEMLGRVAQFYFTEIEKEYANEDLYFHISTFVEMLLAKHKISEEKAGEDGEGSDVSAIFEF